MSKEAMQQYLKGKNAEDHRKSAHQIHHRVNARSHKVA